jgi:3-hydroxybutyryl-CoA dehydrogenase
MPLDIETIVGVVGAGAMGTGIAHVAAVAGHRVVLADAREGAAQAAQARIAKAMEREVEKGRLSQNAADEVLARIDFQWAPLGGDLSAYRRCGLVIEAVVEDLAEKRALFHALEGAVSSTAVLATNTSSLAVASIASACDVPERVVGLHFFNPAPVMQLVEVVPWLGGDPTIATASYALMRRWNKTPVLASDTPGFIVNRVARHFYGEPLRIHAEGVDVAQIDRIMREAGGFKMGPFELMDLIGLDVNFAVTRAVFGAFYGDPRYRPHPIQERMVDAGLLGRKSGRGFYRYDDADG